MTATSTETTYTAAAYGREFDHAADAMADNTITGTLKAYAAWQTGAITTAALAPLLGKILTAGIMYATDLGDVLGTRATVLLIGRRVLPVGAAGRVDTTTELDRLTAAARTITAALDTGTDPKPRLERIARSEPVNALQQAVVATLAEHQVGGYVRGTDADPCELCVWLKKEHLRPGGFVYPTDKPFYRHTGCQCHPIPVIDTPVYR